MTIELTAVVVLYLLGVSVFRYSMLEGIAQAAVKEGYTYSATAMWTVALMWPVIELVMMLFLRGRIREAEKDDDE
jgi:uncharacterized paraquat-inducible protein A